jgi:fructuronate reductase
MKLSRRTLAGVASGVRHPSFDPATLRPRIVHLGVDAFHRAHRSVATQRELATEFGN